MATSHPKNPTAGPRILLALIAVAAVLALTFSPRRLVAPARGAFMHLAHVWAGPVVEPMTFTQVESILNALMFVPLGAALALLLSRRMWILAPMIGFAISFGVEVVQSRIPGRVPDIQDIVWNTVGAIAGASVAGMLRLVHRGLRRHARIAVRAG